MKRNKNIFKIFSLVILLSFFSCNDFEEINTNPNEPTTVPAEYLLTSSQKFLMDVIWDQWHNGRMGMVYAQYWAQNDYTEESRYQLRAGTNDSYWQYYYAGRDLPPASTTTLNGGGLQDLQEIININTENDLGAISQNQIAVARIMKAWMFQIVTDIWGDVPYTEALKARENPSPAYSPQAEIYTDLLKELKEASDQIVIGEESFGAGDLIYQGDMEKWKKFANSLRLRVAIRMADRDAAAAGTAIQEAVAAGVFTSNEDNALLNYLPAFPNNNPLHEDRKTREDFAVSEPLINKLLELNDPRISSYAEKALESGEYVGMPYGVTNAQASAISNPSVSQPSSLVLAATAPGIYMDYAEVQFTLAEAVERGFISSGTAAEFYNEGIKASMNFWGISDDAAINAYLSSPGVAYSSANWKQTIGVQKWLALYMQGIQGWSEWRRLDFTGVLVLPRGGVLVGEGIPVRVTYPSTEQNLNPQGYSGAVQRQGADLLSTKMWWDVN